MLHEIEYLQIAENPITMIDAVMQAIGNSAMPERQEEIVVDTDTGPNVSLDLVDKTV
jgi:ribosomal protein L1